MIVALVLLIATAVCASPPALSLDVQPIITYVDGQVSIVIQSATINGSCEVR